MTKLSQDDLDIQKLFGERLKALRTQKNISLEELADKINVSRQSIIYYQMGTRIPSGAKLVGLAKCLGTTIDYLLGITENSETNTNCTGCVGLVHGVCVIPKCGGNIDRQTALNMRDKETARILYHFATQNVDKNNCQNCVAYAHNRCLSPECFGAVSVSDMSNLSNETRTKLYCDRWNINERTMQT